jgi:hypothetical protein
MSNLKCILIVFSSAFTVYALLPALLQLTSETENPLWYMLSLQERAVDEW